VRCGSRPAERSWEAAVILYAIVPRRTSRALGNGLARGPLRSARAGGAWVVFEEGDLPEPDPRSLRAYDRVVRRIAREASAVLPFRYGTVAADEGALARLLDPIAPAVTASLAQVRECVQYTLRVYGEALPEPPPDAAAGPGARWLARRMGKHRAPEIAPVLDATSSLLRASRVERHDRAPLVASVYHLVPRKDARAYRAALARGSSTLRTVRVEATGPWPPYAFAELP
jgi:hypothetical protein